MLQQLSGVRVVATARSMTEMDGVVARDRIDVLLIGLEPISQAIEVARHYPELPAVIFSVSAGRDHSIEAIRAGVLGLLSKDADVTEVAEALQLIASGGRAFPPGWERWLIEWTEGSKRRTRRSEIEPLTVREREIVQFVVQGCSNKQIAAALGIAVQTVENHLHNIMSKLDVVSRTELVSWASESGCSQSDSVSSPP